MATRQKQRHHKRQRTELPKRSIKQVEPEQRVVLPIRGASDKPEVVVKPAPPLLNPPPLPNPPARVSQLPAPSTISAFPPILPGEPYGIRCTGWGRDVTLGFPQGGGVVLVVG